MSRDYRAERERRNALARSRGFENYSQQRKAIESGRAAAIQPSRIRSAKTFKAQERSYGAVGRAERDVAYLKSLDVKGMRIERADRFSKFYAHSSALKFDPVRARRDPAYLDAYTQGYVMADTRERDAHRYSRDADRKHWLVNITHYMTAEEYDEQYPE